MQKAQQIQQINLEPTYMIMPNQFSNIKKIALAQSGSLDFVIAFDKENLYVSPLVETSIASINNHNAQKSDVQSKSLHMTEKSSTLNNQPNNCFLQIFAIPNIKDIHVIAKNTILITTQANYIGLFSIMTSKNAQNQQNQTSPKVGGTTSSFSFPKIEFQIVMQWVVHKSYFIRQVIENIFQVQIFVNDNQLIVYQFTTKNKLGRMTFTMNVNGKIKNSQKTQIYGSKCFINLNKKALYTLKNFGDKSFIITPILINGMFQVGTTKNMSVHNQPTQQSTLIGIFGLKGQQYYGVYSNLTVVQCSSPLNSHKILQRQGQNSNTGRQVFAQKYAKLQIQKNPYSQAVQISQTSQQVIKYSQFLDYLMVQDNQNGKLSVYQIKQKNSCIIDCQYWNNDQNCRWFFGWGKKLINLSTSKGIIKFVNQLKVKDRQVQLKEVIKKQIKSEHHHNFEVKNQQNVSKTQETHHQISPQRVKTLKDKKPNKAAQLKKSIEIQNKNQQKKTVSQSSQIKKDQFIQTKIKQLQKKEQLPQTQVKTQTILGTMAQEGSTKEIKNQNNQKKQQNLSAHKFKPMKVIQRNKTSVSKTLQKSKQITPLESQPKNQTKDDKNIDIQINIQIKKEQEPKKQNAKNEQKPKENIKQHQITTNTDNTKTNSRIQLNQEKNNVQISKVNGQQVRQKQAQRQKSQQRQNRPFYVKTEDKINKHIFFHNQVQPQKNNLSKKEVQMLSEDSDFTQEEDALSQQSQIQKQNKIKPENSRQTLKKKEQKFEKNIQIQQKHQGKTQQKRQQQKISSHNLESLSQNKFIQKEEVNKVNTNKLGLWADLSQSQSQSQQQYQQKLVSSLLQEDESQDKTQRSPTKDKDQQSKVISNSNASSNSKPNKDQDIKRLFSTNINRNKIFGTQNQDKASVSPNSNPFSGSQNQNQSPDIKHPIIVTDQALDKIFKVKSSGEKSNFILPSIFKNNSQNQKQRQQSLSTQNLKNETRPIEANKNPFKFQSFSLFSQNPLPTSPYIPKLSLPIPATNIFGGGNSKSISNSQKGQTSIFQKPIQSKVPQQNQAKKIQTVQQNNNKVNQQNLVNSKMNKKMEQIQAYIQKFQETLIKSIQQSQKSVLKKVQQIPQTHNPYSKSSSLVFPNQIKDELVNQLKVQVKKWLIQEMFKKIQASFKQIMMDHKGVYDQALQYYQMQAKKKISSLQLQFQQQNVMLNEMQLISNNMKASLQNIILEGEQMHTFQLKQFKRQIQTSSQSLQEISSYMSNPKLIKEKQQRSKKYEDTLTQLKQLKQILKQKQKIREEKKLKKHQQKVQLERERAEKQRLRLKKQKKIIEKKIKKDSQMQQEKKKTSKNKKQNSKEKERKKLNRTVQY